MRKRFSCLRKLAHLSLCFARITAWVHAVHSVQHNLGPCFSRAPVDYQTWVIYSGRMDSRDQKRTCDLSLPLSLAPSWVCSGANVVLEDTILYGVKPCTNTSYCKPCFLGSHPIPFIVTPDHAIQCLSTVRVLPELKRISIRNRVLTLMPDAFVCF